MINLYNRDCLEAMREMASKRLEAHQRQLTLF
jgi:hypothetical protein